MILSLAVNAANIVKDNETGLIWQDTQDVKKKNWNDAIKYCIDLELNEFTDWRLPSIDELMSISDKTRYKPAIKKIFKNNRNDWYWTSTKFSGDLSSAWIVGFKNGYDSSHDLVEKNYVRCVR
jgi:hypothetical protein